MIWAQGLSRCCEDNFTGLLLHVHVNAGAGGTAARSEVGSVRGRAVFRKLARLQTDRQTREKTWQDKLRGGTWLSRGAADFGFDSPGLGIDLVARCQTARPAPCAVCLSGLQEHQILAWRFLCYCHHMAYLRLNPSLWKDTMNRHNTEDKKMILVDAALTEGDHHLVTAPLLSITSKTIKTRWKEVYHQEI